MPRQNKTFSTKPIGLEKKEAKAVTVKTTKDALDKPTKADKFTKTVKKNIKRKIKGARKEKIKYVEELQTEQDILGKKTLEQPDPYELGTEKEEEISKKLNDIYQDRNGQMPNMRRIKVRKSHPIIKFFLYFIVIGSFMCAITWIGLFVFPQSNFSDDKISLEITGEQEISLAQTAIYTISIDNYQNKTIKDAILSVQSPNGFVFTGSDPTATNKGNTEWRIGDIKPYERKEIKIQGITYGNAKEEESWRASLTYSQEKYQFTGQKTTNLPIKLKKMPFVLSILSPDKAVVGSEITYSYKLENLDSQQIGNLNLQTSWSTNFSIATSSPSLDKNNAWIIDTNTTTNNWTLKVQGRYISTTEKFASASGIISIPINQTGQNYKLVEQTAQTMLEYNNLNLSLAINGKLNNFSSQPNDTLNMTIYLKNSSMEDLGDVNVKLIIDAPSALNRSLMDWGNIVDELDGAIRGLQLSNEVRRGQISWNQKMDPSLKDMSPGDDISMNVSLPIRGIDKFPLDTLNTYLINVSAQADYETDGKERKALTGNAINITVNSDFAIEVRDKESTSDDGKQKHEIKWILTNNFHELKNISLTADIYGKAVLEAGTQAPAGEFIYDETTKEMSWKIDSMPLAVDVLALPFTIILDETNPSQNVLVSAVKVEATDVVTGEIIQLNGEEIKLKSE
ncbi:MAG: hypothetical protein ABH832_02710 [bacterium]